MKNIKNQCKNQCLVDNKSLNFSRSAYAVLVLFAVFLKDENIFIFLIVLTILGGFSLKYNIYNIFYQIHKILKKKNTEITLRKRNFDEATFGFLAAGIFFLIGFFVLKFTPYTSFAWNYVLFVVGLVVITSILDFCIATFVYVVIKNKLSRK